MTKRFAARGRVLGLLVAAVALAGQIALGAVVLGAPAQKPATAQLAAVALLCHPGGNSAGAAKRLPHPPANPAFAAVALAAAQAANLLGPASLCLRAPPARAPAIPEPPRPAAAPPALRLAAQPRAPPSLT